MATRLSSGVLDPQTPFQTTYAPRRHANKRPSLSKSIAAVARALRSKMTDRDYQILSQLYAIGTMSRHQIERLHWSGAALTNRAKVTSNRLNLLYKRHVLDKNPYNDAVLREAGMVACNTDALDSVGYQLLADAEQIERHHLKQVKRNYRKGYGLPNVAIHDLMVAELFVQLSLETRHHHIPARWVGEWHCSIYEGEREWVRPDGLMIFNPPNQPVAHYFVELDRTTPYHPRKRWLQKVQAYEAARQRGQWQGTFGMQTFPSVTAVVPTGYGARVTQVLREAQPTVTWLVKEWGAVLTEGILTAWHECVTGHLVEQL